MGYTRQHYENRHTDVQFTYNRFGYHLDVNVKYSRNFTSPSFNGPYDADWEVDNIEILDVDGEDVGAEIDGVFFKELNRFQGKLVDVSIYDDLLREAGERIEA